MFKNIFKNITKERKKKKISQTLAGMELEL
jgi:hypothetical protein